MKRKKLLTFLIAGVIAILLATVGVLAWKFQQVSKNESNEAKETSSRIIKEVESLYLLPKGEEPTVAQIQDKKKLDDQAFFEDAQNGDYLLVYQENKLALIYRENAGKLVNVGPINIGGADQTREENNSAESGETAGERIP